MLPDLKFREAFQIPHWWHLKGRKYKHSLCTKAAETYSANLTRAHMLTRTPGIPFRYGKIYKEAQFRLWNERGNFDPLDMSDRQTHHRVWQLFSEIGSKESAEYASGHDIDSTLRIEEICSTNEAMHSALEAILQSSLIQAWTAFEVLAEDLWKRVTKLRPKIDTRSEQEQNQSGHRSRSKIAKLYELTFRSDNHAIMRAVDNHRVHALGIMRNVLVHNGGTIDEGFVNARKPTIRKGKSKKLVKQRGWKYLKCIRGRSIGYKILFTGPLVRRFVDPVTPLGFDLVRAVDRWLDKH